MSDDVETRTVDAHIRNLRKKIGPDRIRTVIGFGYRFDPGLGRAMKRLLVVVLLIAFSVAAEEPLTNDDVEPCRRRSDAGHDRDEDLQFGDGVPHGR